MVAKKTSYINMKSFYFLLFSVEIAFILLSFLPFVDGVLPKEDVGF